MFEKLTAFMAGTALVCTLSACGGGGGGSTPTSQPNAQTSAAPAAQKYASVAVGMYGDSTMRGLECLGGGKYGVTAGNVPAILQTLLQNQFGSRVTTVNHGDPGATAVQLLRGGGPVPVDWSTAMQQSSEQIIVLNPGINDDESTDDFMFVIGQLQEIAKSYGKTVLIETPNPAVNGEPRLTNFAVAEVQNAWGDTVIDTYSAFAQLPNWGDDLCDGIHPTDNGYNFIATYVVYPVVQKVVASMLTS